MLEKYKSWRGNELVPIEYVFCELQIPADSSYPKAVVIKKEIRGYYGLTPRTRLPGFISKEDFIFLVAYLLDDS